MHEVTNQKPVLTTDTTQHMTSYLVDELNHFRMFGLLSEDLLIHLLNLEVVLDGHLGRARDTRGQGLGTPHSRFLIMLT